MHRKSHDAIRKLHLVRSLSVCKASMFVCFKASNLVERSSSMSLVNHCQLSQSPKCELKLVSLWTKLVSSMRTQSFLAQTLYCFGVYTVATWIDPHCNCNSFLCVCSLRLVWTLLGCLNLSIGCILMQNRMTQSWDCVVLDCSVSGHESRYLKLKPFFSA